MPKEKSKKINGIPFEKALPDMRIQINRRITEPDVKTRLQKYCEEHCLDNGPAVISLAMQKLRELYPVNA